MANLAIKGHATRGKEVIEILEMLGGINTYKINYTENNLLYCLREGDNVIIATYPNSSITNVFTLEEFLEKYPYKVGDKVKDVRINDSIGIITNVRWDDNEEQIIYVVEWDDAIKSTLMYFARGLQPYKEETMGKEIIYDEIDFNRCPCADKVQLILGDDFEIKVEDGKTFVVRKKNQYPKTYEECCEVLSLGEDSRLYTIVVMSL